MVGIPFLSLSESLVKQFLFSIAFLFCTVPAVAQTPTEARQAAQDAYTAAAEEIAAAQGYIDNTNDIGQQIIYMCDAADPACVPNPLWIPSANDLQIPLDAISTPPDGSLAKGHLYVNMGDQVQHDALKIAYYNQAVVWYDTAKDEAEAITCDAYQAEFDAQNWLEELGEILSNCEEE